MKRIILLIFLGVLVAILLNLPDNFQFKSQNLSEEIEFNRLPDENLRAIAEQEWEAGRKETAIAILDYIIEENMGDTANAKIRREQYLEIIKSDESPIGKVRAAAYGFVTGKVDNLSSLVGSSAADLIIYGDVRDLIRETVFEDDADEIVVALSSAGIITTNFPLLEAPCTIMKSLKKVSALSAPMVDLLKRMFKGFVSLSDIGKKAKIEEAFVPFYNLAKKTRTWGEFTTLARYSQNIHHVKLLTGLSSMSPNNAKKLTQILSVGGNQGMKTTGQALEYIEKYGQKGMDQLYSVLRKGPKGIKFIAEHPTLTFRILKNTKKTGNLIANTIIDKWGELCVKNRFLSMAFKYGLAFILIVFIINQIFVVFNTKTKGIETNKRKSWLPVIALSLTILVFFFAFNFRDQYQNQPEQSISAGYDQTSNLTSRPIQKADSFDDIIFLAFIIICNMIIQAYLINMAKKKISQVQKKSANSSSKLSLLDNLDIYFDLPMYFGLGMTIFAFILITFLGAESARLSAYSSTLIGIGCTAYMRVAFLQKAKEEVINETQTHIEKIREIQ